MALELRKVSGSQYRYRMLHTVHYCTASKERGEVSLNVGWMHAWSGTYNQRYQTKSALVPFLEEQRQNPVERSGCPTYKNSVLVEEELKYIIYL